MTLHDTSPDLAVSDLRVEHLREPFGIGISRPRLTWTIQTSTPDWRQSAYEVRAESAAGRPRGETGKVASDQSVLVPWPFEPLASREHVVVQVRVWESAATPSPWSAPVAIEAGLLDATDWSARFVTPDWDEDTSRPEPGPLLRHEFVVRKGVARARLYLTALGVYEAEINGFAVGDHILAPGWTSYSHRLRYQIHDVTRLLREGPNALGAYLGDGWFRGRLGWGGGRRGVYGDRLALCAQLEITYDDGSTERVVTDDAWRAASGPMRASDLYDGETYDARLERPGWSTAGFDDSDWTGVRVLDHDFSTLVAPTGPPVRRIETIKPVAITTSPAGRTILDFGQNLVGRLRLTVRGEAGQTITLRHAEVLERDELATRPLRFARATDQYILRGGASETWEPRFTFHGFRYAEVEGWPGTLTVDDVVAVVCHSDLERTGWFECSDPLVNRLHENVVWSMRGNFLDVPTDCPQRDERLGWTGDIQAFAPTACFLYDSAGFLASWLADLAAEQDASGAVPFVVPNPFEGPLRPAAAWGDATVIVPWVLYQRFGDPGILDRQFESMCRWVDCVAEQAGPSRLWNRGFQFGDWLDPSAPPDRPGDGKTDPYLVATAYFAHSAELVGRAASVLGRAEVAARYQSLAARVREAFDDEYVTPSGRLVSDSTTAYGLAIRFGLLRDDDQRRHAGERLTALVRSGGYRVTTGFVGTPLICDALCGVGEFDAAFRLLLQRACPSWLYPVTMGATTIWERWDSLLSDGSINPGEMTSFNHYAFGAIADWLHRTVAGLAPAEPGYRRLVVRPRPGGGLTHARARHRTPYGIAECGWTLEAGRVEVDLTVPPNTTATITLPGRPVETIDVGSGTYHWSREDPTPRLPRRALDSTLGDLVADIAAWNAIVGVAPELAGLDVGLRGRESMPLRMALDLRSLSAEKVAAIEAALAGLGRT